MIRIEVFSILFIFSLVFTIWWYHFAYNPIITFDTLSTRTISNNFSTTKSYQISTNATFIPTTKMPESRLKYFHATMTANQKAGMLNLTKIFKNQMQKYNITYFLYGGSLIGANRHHGFIPWDDDIDILVDSNKKQQLKMALQELNKTHKLTYNDDLETRRWKFYKLDGHPFSHTTFRYPYLDLFFFKEFNETMFYVEKENELMWKKDIFPLVDKMFEGISLPTPCNTDGVLKVSYENLNKCSSPSWNHSIEYRVSSSQQVQIDCDLLKSSFPFVDRTMTKMSDNNHVKEILKLGKTVLQIVTYSTPLVCSVNYSHYPSDLSVTKL